MYLFYSFLDFVCGDMGCKYRGCELVYVLSGLRVGRMVEVEEVIERGLLKFVGGEGTSKSNDVSCAISSLFDVGDAFVMWIGANISYMFGVLVCMLPGCD